MGLLSRAPWSHQSSNLLLVQNHICKWRNHPRLGSGAEIAGHGCILKHIRSSKRYSLKSFGASISCSTGVESKDKDFLLPPISELAEAKIIYSVAPAMGHNKHQRIFTWVDNIQKAQGQSPLLLVHNSLLKEVDHFLDS